MMIKTVNGASSTAPFSNVIEQPPLATWRLGLYFVGLGALGVVLHASLRVPLHLPGHHGLEWMALLAFASMTIPRRWAATGVGIAATAIAFLPLWGWHDLFAPQLYLASAMFFDLFCVVLPRRQLRRTLVVLAGGLAFTAAGLIGFLVGPHGATAHAAWGLWTLMHFGFGLAGALIGMQLGAWTLARLEAHP